MDLPGTVWPTVRKIRGTRAYRAGQVGFSGQLITLAAATATVRLRARIVGLSRQLGPAAMSLGLVRREVVTLKILAWITEGASA